MTGKRLLFVDDETQLLDICKEAFEMEGFDVLTASNGKKALDMLGESHVDAVVSDLKMPGMDGQGLLEKITLGWPSIPVIILTGYGTVENAVECLRKGAADYLLKPFRMDDLFSKIQDCLSKFRPQGFVQGNRLETVLSAVKALGRETDSRGFIATLTECLNCLFTPDGISLYKRAESNGHYTVFFARGAALSDPVIQRALLKRMASDDFSFPSLINGSQVGIPSLGCLVVTSLDSGATSQTILLLHRDKSKPAFVEDDIRRLSLLRVQAGALLDVLYTSNRLSGLNLEIITSLTHAVEAKDYYTRGHSDRVSSFAAHLGAAIGLPTSELTSLKQAALLHDIGKIGVPDQILNKPGPLTTDERRIMRCHPSIGRDILSHISGLRPMLTAIYHHHERFDGRGYPEGLAGEDIPLCARIIAVVDGFEAIISHRAYHRARGLEEAKSILKRGSGGQWDPLIVEKWLQLLDRNTVDDLSKEFVPN